MNTFPLSLGFEDVAITQNKNICHSRLDVDISSEIIKGVKRPLPFIAANMSTVINSSFYIKLYKLGAFGILHRALPEDNYLTEVETVAKECEWVAASIGVGHDQYQLAEKLINKGCNIIVIDVAHGYADYVMDLGRKLKRNFKHIKLVIGNTVNPNMIAEVYDFADAIKVGIGAGAACETKNTAGCTEKQFSAVYKFNHNVIVLNDGSYFKYGEIPIISDGGIREPADAVKAIAAGANSVMMGSVFARCPESAAEIISYNDKSKKLYAGMASTYVQKEWKGGLKPGTCAEGGIRYLDIGAPAEKILEIYCGALRSGITYAGGSDIKSFKENVNFVRFK